MDTGPESFALTSPVAPPRTPRPERLLPVSEQQGAFDIDRAPRFPMASQRIPPATPGGLERLEKRSRLAGRSEVRAQHQRKADKINNLDDFTRAYIEAALWSTNDESDEQGGEPLEKNYSASDIAPETMEKMIADAADFQERFGELYSDSSQAGHDFWLTRIGHGAGFWDGDYPEPEATKLTDASKEYGEFYLYIGDDGMIYGPPKGAYGVRAATNHKRFGRRFAPGGLREPVTNKRAVRALLAFAEAAEELNAALAPGEVPAQSAYPFQISFDEVENQISDWAQAARRGHR
jgi:hypothetical protein